METTLFEAFKAARQPRLVYPARAAIETARQRLARLAQQEADADAAREELAQLWAALGKVEPKRFSPEGERLAHARNVSRDAAELARRARRAVTAPGKPWHGPQRTAGQVYFEAPESAFRDVRAAHDVDGGPDHNGWFDNPHGESARDGSGLIWGVVAQLPGRNGAARYVAGYRNGGDEGATLDLSTVYESSDGGAWDSPSALRDAAQAADSIAEQAAEQEREYQEAWQLGQRYADAGERLADVRGQILAILAERKAAPAAQLPALCRAIRERVAQLLAERAELHTERAEALDSGPSWNREAVRAFRDAFAEGAGMDSAEQGRAFG